MLPTTLAILSTTFHGRERATAFAAWGATVGVGVAFGPVVGGFLTTNYSWRWAFGINVIVAPLAILGAHAVHAPRAAAPTRRIAIDVPGACLDRERDVPLRVRAERRRALRLVPAARALHARRGRRLARDARGVDHPARDASSRAVVLFALLPARAVEGAPRPRARCSSSASCATAGFRYGLLTDQRARDGPARHVLRAAGLPAGRASTSRRRPTGSGCCRSGVFIIVGSQLGGRLTRHIGVTRVVQLGLVLEVDRARRRSRSCVEPDDHVRRPARSAAGCSASASASPARSSPT